MRTKIGQVSFSRSQCRFTARLGISHDGRSWHRSPPVTRSVFRRTPVTAGLYGAEETARRSFPSPTKSTQAGIHRTDRATFSDAARVFDRVRVVARRQGAHSVESCRTARLDEPAAGLAGSREMIQITAQMRVLVAIEAGRWKKRDRLSSATVPGETSRGSFFRLCV